MAERDGIKLPLERYAELMAHLAFFEGADPLELRDALSIAPEAFDDATARWPLRLRDDQLGGDGALTKSFGASFAATTAKLADAGTTLDQLRARSRSTAAGALDETAAGGIDRGDVLPFVDGDGTPPEQASRGADESAAAGDALGKTAALPSILLDRDATLPFAEAGGLGIEDAVRESLTLEQYASLRSELALRPEQQVAILARYGIADDSSHRLLVAAWDKHLASNADERRTLEGLMRRYSAWLRQQMG
jgi:hypothetical protein